MVKKLSRIAALLAAGALLLGAIGCSDGGRSGGGGPSFTSQTANFDVAKEDERVTSVSEDVTFNPEGIAEVTAVDGTTITVTSLKAGTTTMTIKVSGEGFTDEPVEIKIKVAADGGISVVDEEPDDDDALKKSGTFEVDITQLPFSVTDGLTDTVNTDGKNGKFVIKNGTTLADGYFKIVQNEGKSNTAYYSDSKKTKISAIELDKQSNNTYIEFTVTGSAVVTVSATSTDKDNSAYVEIVAANTKSTIETATEVKGSNNGNTTITKTCTAGTYWIVVVQDYKLARIDSIRAVQTVN